MSFDVILPFLRPIESLIKDPSVSEIMVNGPACVFIERDGQLSLVPGITIPEKSLQVALIPQKSMRSRKKLILFTER